jgi:23S rRNA pseudouridine1911/1915/1917 synthase
MTDEPAAPETLRARLRRELPASSGRQIRQWLAAGRIVVNGRIARDARAPVAPGDTVRLAPRPAPPFPAPLRLVHEDAALIVLDKPPGLRTVADSRERRRTVYRLVWDYLAARREGRPFVVHRLDRETSGLLVLAKSPPVQAHLQAQFAARTAERGYLALVTGRVAADTGTLRSRLAEDAGLRVRSVRGRRRDPDRSREAITHYRVLARHRDTTLLDLSLETGRRHQIRVQLADLGHPIVGDPAHGGPAGPLGRLALHATRLGFVHPLSRQRVRFDSPPPAALAVAFRPVPVDAPRRAR